MTEEDERTPRSVVGRSRWTPKPEQIRILESIFNTGMVNPPKDEIVKIRKVLQKFGSLGDANVFYWFQNRRSRVRRQQRLIQATVIAASPEQQQQQTPRGIHYQHAAAALSNTPGFARQQPVAAVNFLPTKSFLPEASSSSRTHDYSNFTSGDEPSAYPQMLDHHNTFMASGFLHADASKLHYQHGGGEGACVTNPEGKHEQGTNVREESRDVELTWWL